MVTGSGGDDGDEHTRRDTSVGERILGDAAQALGDRVARTDRYLRQLYLLDYRSHTGDGRQKRHAGPTYP